MSNDQQEDSTIGEANEKSSDQHGRLFERHSSSLAGYASNSYDSDSSDLDGPS